MIPRAPSMPRQLPLPFAHAARYVPDDFLPAAANEDALVWLGSAGSWPGARLALWGEAGVGKTHLLHLWAARAGAPLCRGEAVRGVPPALASGLAIDDADGAEEETLLHWLNVAAEAERPVLLAARAAPTRWPVRLADLASRLRATTAVELGRPDGELLAALLARLLAERQLAVPAPVQAWMLARLPRSGAAMREAAARLDRAALAAGRGVGRALARAALAGLIDASEEHDATAADVARPQGLL